MEQHRGKSARCLRRGGSWKRGVAGNVGRAGAPVLDPTNHDCLMARVAARISDKRLLKLIRAFLNAGVMEGGLVLPVDEGTPQGGPLSPLPRKLVHAAAVSLGWSVTI